VAAQQVRRFWEKAERGMTASQPASCAFTFRSPCTCETKPRMEVSFFSLALSLGIVVSGLAFTLFRSMMMSDGFSWPLASMRSRMSLSVLGNSTFTLSLRAVSWILVTKNRSSTMARMRVAPFSLGGRGSGSGRAGW
jgi:hypothetical protein